MSRSYLDHFHYASYLFAALDSLGMVVAPEGCVKSTVLT